MRARNESEYFWVIYIDIFIDSWTRLPKVARPFCFLKSACLDEEGRRVILFAFRKEKLVEYYFKQVLKNINKDKDLKKWFCFTSFFISLFTNSLNK